MVAALTAAAVMYSRITALKLAENAMANGESRRSRSRRLERPARYDWRSETLQYIEYDCMAVKLNDASQVTICC